MLVQVVHTRCVGPQYSVILKKMLRCVDHLPLTPNDIHTASSAHGSFGDVLHQLCRHTDLEVSHPIHKQYLQHEDAMCLSHWPCKSLLPQLHLHIYWERYWNEHEWLDTELLSGVLGSCRGCWAAAQVKGRAKALLDKQPLSKCSAEVQAAADKAQRERRSQGGRKRFASRYGGSWGDANGRTPRPHSTPFHNGGGNCTCPILRASFIHSLEIWEARTCQASEALHGRCVMTRCNMWQVCSSYCCVEWAVTRLGCCRPDSGAGRMGQVDAHSADQWLRADCHAHVPQQQHDDACHTRA